jgi:hypothetical protein
MSSRAAKAQPVNQSLSIRAMGLENNERLKWHSPLVTVDIANQF